jgi:3-mercaptopyruvate sulfurtransferase SseA
MELIDRDTLHDKLQRGDDFNLVMALGENAFRAAHIPGSLHFATVEDALAHLDPEEETIVYCSGPTCMASATLYWFLESRGFKNLRRFAGGLQEWTAAGYPLEGEQAT